MMINTTFPNTSPQTLLQTSELYTWRPLRILNIYRVLLSIALTGLFVLLNIDETFFAHSPTLFLGTCYGYVIFAFLAALSVARRRPSFRTQLHAQAIIDCVVICLLIFARGSIGGTLSALLIIAVTGSGILSSRRFTIILASFTTLILLSFQVYLYWLDISDKADFSATGILCIAIYVVPLAANTLSRHAQEFEALAKRQGIDLLSLEHLNEHIIERMQSGVIALNQRDEIRTANEAARHLLGLKHTVIGGEHLQEIAPNLAEKLYLWRDNPSQNTCIIETPSNRAQAKFIQLGDQPEEGVLISLEDESEVAQRVQDAKLASLGRLSAGIAHEIRNPLGAISHASQLLAESPDLPRGDQRLIEIIGDHTDRLNTIVKNVLQLSRRQKPAVEKIHLSDWLPHFIRELSIELKTLPEQFNIDITPEELHIWMDSSHLDQVLRNLCSNAFTHSQQASDSAKVELIGGIDDDTNAIFLEIRDFGKGIDERTAEKIFEPFFTTNANGTGLGLYLSKELCENNGARLQLVSREGYGACFRITFTRYPDLLDE